ncbi:hypothetical protein WA026_019772 [Henosepilachna vigintioctopunctata]|uniref:Uncharacterized protein n=1 Tax=Henosepilachna vigintioctopunctata TaxID=420089 RepID=A0AAW1UQZ7_9CUCU
MLSALFRVTVPSRFSKRAYGCLDAFCLVVDNLYVDTDALFGTVRKCGKMTKWKMGCAFLDAIRNRIKQFLFEELGIRCIILVPSEILKTNMNRLCFHEEVGRHEVFECLQEFPTIE